MNMVSDCLLLIDRIINRRLSTGLNSFLKIVFFVNVELSFVSCHSHLLKPYTLSISK